MWKGRFKEDTADSLLRFGESVSFDWRLYRHDIRGSMAHAKALKAAGILDAAELASICSGLEEIGKEIEDGEFAFDPALEDIHMNIEAELTRRIGDAGARLHTARSRNDQIATDVRLYLRDAIDAIHRAIGHLQSALLRLAEEHCGTVLPGYTHLQRAQPVLLAHHLLAYMEMLERDAGRLLDARRRVNVLPLGSGALAGSTIALDRRLVAEELGFPAISRNSMDAVSDRDFCVEVLSALALLGIHLSRLGEDVVLWASSEFGFIRLSDAYTTGSSLMPQKKNPDVAELARGKSGRLVGNLVAMLTVLKGLPMTYNRDLQEDKEPLFDSLDTVLATLEVMAGMLEEAGFDTGRMAEAASDPFLLATDLADYLVKKGVPFRKAHEAVGRLTALAVETRRPYPDIPLEEYRTISDAFESDVFECLNTESALAARSAPGAPSPENVREQIEDWKCRLRADAPERPES